MLFSIVAAPIYIPTNSEQVFLFLHVLPSTFYLLFFDNSHSHRCEVVSRSGMTCSPPMIRDVEALFMCPEDIQESSVEKGRFGSSAHFSVGLFDFLTLSCMISLYIWTINPLLDLLFANIFSHSFGFLFVLSIVSSMV